MIKYLLTALSFIFIIGCASTQEKVGNDEEREKFKENVEETNEENEKYK